MEGEGEGEENLVECFVPDAGWVAHYIHASASLPEHSAPFEEEPLTHLVLDEVHFVHETEDEGAARVVAESLDAR